MIRSDTFQCPKYLSDAIVLSGGLFQFQKLDNFLHILYSRPSVTETLGLVNHGCFKLVFESL